MRRTSRPAGLFAVLAATLVVMSLPGTTSASSAPAPEATITVRPATPEPILPDVSLERMLGAALASPSTFARPAAAAVASRFRDAQVVSVYGYPEACVMGELGCHSPDEAAARAQQLASAYDAANGERGVIPAMHLIVDVAHASPGADGAYLGRMPIEDIQRYVEVARGRGMLLFVDVQVGWADPLVEVERLRPVLQEPFVHLGLDPEFATKPKLKAPGDAIGTLDAVQVNAVQAYVADLVRLHHLPPKILVLHQFQPGMLTNKPRYAPHPEVEVTVDMDGFGGSEAKLSGYDAYARVDAEYSAFKLFFHWDAPMLTPAELQALPHPPDYVIYQ